MQIDIYAYVCKMTNKQENDMCLFPKKMWIVSSEKERHKHSVRQATKTKAQKSTQSVCFW